MLHKVIGEKAQTRLIENHFIEKKDKQVLVFFYMSFVLNKNINLKYIFGRECPHPNCHSVNAKQRYLHFSIIAIGYVGPTTRHVEPVETSSRQAH